MDIDQLLTHIPDEKITKIEINISYSLRYVDFSFPFHLFLRL